MDILQIIAEINKHITVLNDDYTRMAVDVGVLKSQMEGIIYWSRFAIGGVVLLIISQAYQIFVLHKNGKKK